MEEEILEFKKLLDVSRRLMGPGGCPWDREQTLVSMRSSVLEEACEVIEAIDEGDKNNLKEELGDLLFNVLFFCQLGEKEGLFTTEEVIREIKEKLIKRHPHVFGEAKIEGMEAVLNQWEQLKKEEKNHRESLLDGIPKGLPALARAYKMAKKMKADVDETALEFNSEEELGALLWQLVLEAKKKGIQPEHALRKELLTQESFFREKEKSAKKS